MGYLEENRRRVLQVLTSKEYHIENYEGTILASKYCNRGIGGVMCLLIEVPPPYTKIMAWGNNNRIPSDSAINKMLKDLNSELNNTYKRSESLEAVQ
jgi:hypothetical protein